MRPAPATIFLFACLGLNGCSPPGPPDEERRPAPRAGAPADAPPRSAIVRNADGYKERARAVEADSLEAADRQRAEIDAQTR